jgi:hypothetical protein
MSTSILQHMKGHKVEHIDVHDLPEDQAQFIVAFVTFLREWQRTQHDETAQEHDWTVGSVASFAKDWNNNEDAVYDNWQEHYHVQER